MNPVRIYCHRAHRSEDGMLSPVVRRLALDPDVILTGSQWGSDVVLLPGDRYETARVGLQCFKDGLKIIHLGSYVTVNVLAERFHHDHFYRGALERMASLCLPIEYTIGPTQIADLPDTSARPIVEPYRFVAMNPLPWTVTKLPEIPDDLPIYAADPSRDQGFERLSEAMRRRGWLVQSPLDRALYLRFLRHAEEVWGNSSSLCYEAPLWHGDLAICLYGPRNSGRKIVRWDVERQGHPADNAYKAIRDWLRSDSFRCKGRASLCTVGPLRSM